MAYTVTVSEKGYCSEVLRSVAETGDICPQTTIMVVAAHDRYQRSVSRLYYTDGMVVDVNVSTNHLLAQLEEKQFLSGRNKLRRTIDYCHQI